MLAETRPDFPMWLYRSDEGNLENGLNRESQASTRGGEYDHRDILDYNKEVSFMADYTEDDEPVERLRRYVGGEASLNVSLLHHMTTGQWYLAFYNDALAQTQVAIWTYFNIAICIFYYQGVK